MTVCAACGERNEASAKFCSDCGSRIATVGAHEREERKVVTVLFADLVGFTSRSEELDPEDVRALLSPYYARLRGELERFGGTVEKFIGDAVMALFGAPIAHEDDPERAVRAALAIREWVAHDETGLQLRIAVNTGEALVALNARPGQGEGMASGDVVNTTARLQTAAPVNGILVGEATYRATSQAITYAPAEPITAKGKSQPVRAWVAVEARSRFGVDLGSTSRTPLVGRAHEVGMLTNALARVQRERTAQLVTIVGVPGIGKSRLVSELFAAIEKGSRGLVQWRQGRSLPYGAGITFWALAEMVKAQAGILEGDGPEQVEEKVCASVAELIPERADADWVTTHLRPLAGVGATNDTSRDRRDEAFAAWRRYFEGLAERNPLVLVFEDLHWADASVLDFIEHLVDWAAGVPLLVVCTSRPELFERRPGWGGGSRHAITLSLSPLSEDETAEIIGSLSASMLLPGSRRQDLLARAGGNPLYAEQFMRMVVEAGGADELPLPETVQGIIAARLDALPDEEKRLLQAAAVMGKVFWLGALLTPDAADRRAVERSLHALERKDFVRHSRRSSVAEEAEYAFLHVLVRDVAYGQIPRGRRAEQHRLAAQWISSLGRPEDHAELLAHHYQSALALLRATGAPHDEGMVAHAFISLRAAGDRAASLHSYSHASDYYQTALELDSSDVRVRASLLLTLGRARLTCGDFDPKILTAASAAFLDVADTEGEAEAEALLAEVYSATGDRDLCYEHLRRAHALAESLDGSRAKAKVLCQVSRYSMLAADCDRAIRVGREALHIADELGLGDLRASALQVIGSARVDTGDLAGLDDIEKAVEIAIAADAPAEAVRAQGNLGGSLYQLGRIKEGLSLKEQAGATAMRFGLLAYGRHNRAERALLTFDLGRWGEALDLADTVLTDGGAAASKYPAAWCFTTRAQIRLGLDQIAAATQDVDRALDLARPAKDPQVLCSTLALCTEILREAGDRQRAGQLADEFLREVASNPSVGHSASQLHVLAWAFVSLGRGEELGDHLPTSDVPWIRAAAAFVAGDVAGAADICAGMGAATEEARDRLWLAEALIKQGRRDEADVQRHHALDFYRTVGASRYILACEALATGPA